jgi:putative transposase
MWTPEDRRRYNRDHLRYPSDLTDEEWALVEPLIPPAKRGGRRRSVDMRNVVNGLMYVLSTGCQWRYVPKDLPPKRGIQLDPCGYDAGKKIKGKKRHILVDTEGLLMHAIVHPPDVQDRDGGVLLISTLFGLYPFLRKIFADGGYQGPVFEQATAMLLADVEIEIVKRSDAAKGFVVLPRRWVVERTFAWLNRCRRLAEDCENRTRNALAFLQPVSIRLMTRKLCNP